jgi:hypothetical protein
MMATHRDRGAVDDGNAAGLPPGKIVVTRGCAAGPDRV